MLILALWHPAAGLRPLEAPDCSRGRRHCRQDAGTRVQHTLARPLLLSLAQPVRRPNRTAPHCVQPPNVTYCTHRERTPPVAPSSGAYPHTRPRADNRHLFGACVRGIPHSSRSLQDLSLIFDTPPSSSWPRACVGVLPIARGTPEAAGTLRRTTLSAHESLDGGETVPGFAYTVAHLFL